MAPKINAAKELAKEPFVYTTYSSYMCKSIDELEWQGRGVHVL